MGGGLTMGLFIGDKQLDMFSMLRKDNYVRAVDYLPSDSALAEKDVGKAYCLMTSYDQFLSGHIYKVVKNGNLIEYVDLNADGAGISAIYNHDGSLRV